MDKVFGHGPDVSPIMIVSDYPTKDELISGKAINGYTATMADSFLKQNGWSLDRCYKTSYIKVGMEGYNTKNKKKKKEIYDKAFCQDDWRSILEKEIQEIKPNVIVALGEHALNTLTLQININRYRGSVLPVNQYYKLENNVRIVPTFHPRDVHARPISSVYVVLDYGKATKHKYNTTKYDEVENLWIARTSEVLLSYWKRIKDASFLTFDIETLYNFATCIGFCADGKEAVSVPLLDFQTSAMERMCIWRIVNDILKSKIPKVNQNICYDWTVLERLGFTIRNIVGDTMLMANTIYPELPKGLDFLTSIYTDIPYYKDEGKEYDANLHDFSRMLFYNAKDALSTWQVWDKQQADAEEMGVKSFYFNYVHNFLIHYKKINDRGLLVDELERQKLVEKYDFLLADHLYTLEDVYGKSLNTESPKQVAEFVYGYLDCPRHYHLTPNGDEVLSTGEEILEEIYLNEIQDDARKLLLKEILFCRKIEKILQYLRTPYHWDNRMRTLVKVAGTENGRTSGTDYIGCYFIHDSKKGTQRGKLGLSFQTFPKHGFDFEGQRFGDDLRRIFVPTPGYVFIAADGSNAEGRIVCVLSEDWDMLHFMHSIHPATNKLGDMHALTASWIYNKPYQAIKKPSDERDIGKMARHAGNLGQGPKGLSQHIHKSVKFCTEVMTRFHKNAPKVIETFHGSIKRHVSRERKLINPFGRRRDFFDNLTEEVYKQAFSFLPQSTCSDHYKIASLRIIEKAPWAYQVFEAHDGLMWEVPIDKKDEFLQIIDKELSVPINFKNCILSRDYDLVIPVDMEWSNTNWCDMESIKLEKSEEEVA